MRYVLPGPMAVASAGKHVLIDSKSESGIIADDDDLLMNAKIVEC